MERESLTQVQKTIENTTWERLKSLVSQHWTPQVRPARGSPVTTWEPLLCGGDCSLSCFFFLSSQWPQTGIPVLLESGKSWSCVIWLDNEWRTLHMLRRCKGRGISISVSKLWKLCYKSEPNWGEVVILAHFWHPESFKKIIKIISYHMNIWMNGS